MRPTACGSAYQPRRYSPGPRHQGPRYVDSVQFVTRRLSVHNLRRSPDAGEEYEQFADEAGSLYGLALTTKYVPRPLGLATSL
jgi:hypothetical protein